MLGEQWTGTYWEEGGRNITSKQNPDTLRIEGRGPVEEVGGDLQGMFWSPESGTRTGSDPWEDQDARRQVIQSKLSLTDDDLKSPEYQKRGRTVLNQGRYFQPKKPPGFTSTRRSADRMVESIRRSDLPTHELERMRSVPAFITSESVGRRNAGVYYPADDIIAVRETKSKQYVRGTERIATAGGALIKNPKPLDPDKWSISGVYADGYPNPTPETYSEHGTPDERRDRSYEDVVAGVERRNLAYKEKLPSYLERYGSEDRIPDYLRPRDTPSREDHKLNADQIDQAVDPATLWTKGGESSKYFAERATYPDTEQTQEAGIAGRSIRGWQRNTQQLRDTDMWFRREPTEFEERETFKSKTVTAVPMSTALHELGHAQDRKRVRANDGARAAERRADPIEEGIADGFADRYTDPQVPEYYESSTYDERIKKQRYGAEYSGWRNNDERAAYTAARYHVATGGEIEDIPRRGDLHSQAYWRTDEDVEPNTTRLTTGELQRRSPAARRATQRAGYADYRTEAFEQLSGQQRLF